MAKGGPVYLFFHLSGYLCQAGNKALYRKCQFFEGGRTFNGPPGSGGGYIQMEYTSLTGDHLYPFQSTLVHEIGHACGLLHVDSFGYDMQTNESLMSYNLSHHSNGMRQSDTPGIFNPEDYCLLSLKLYMWLYVKKAGKRLIRNLMRL